MESPVFDKMNSKQIKNFSSWYPVLQLTTVPFRTSVGLVAATLKNATTMKILPYGLSDQRIHRKLFCNGSLLTTNGGSVEKFIFEAAPETSGRGAGIRFPEIIQSRVG
jgi:hypothetical protein